MKANIYFCLNFDLSTFPCSISNRERSRWSRREVECFTGDDGFLSLSESVHRTFSSRSVKDNLVTLSVSMKIKSISLRVTVLPDVISSLLCFKMEVLDMMTTASTAGVSSSVFSRNFLESNARKSSQDYWFKRS